MSEVKFTKGPWEIKPIEDDKEYIRVRGTRLGEEFKIANVIDLKNHHDGSKWCDRDRERSMANARLIAKAPEMHEMLNEMVKLFESVECGESEFRLISEAKDLLKQVRGE